MGWNDTLGEKALSAESAAVWSCRARFASAFDKAEPRFPFTCEGVCGRLRFELRGSSDSTWSPSSHSSRSLVGELSLPADSDPDPDPVPWELPHPDPPFEEPLPFELLLSPPLDECPLEDCPWESLVPLAEPM
eukprot:CAMPEP_0180164716 /NCGR_PEP_ID=MMETSP0986-20121125/30544_1 /TAXON_ID=697907 /ORGANISM="non described non described, Strain CCMP2293" /LENGTH=132 /DNA_ID=CAMNT_0022115563 /DNA_START=136 /DNA_END=534 /DNA_ORIENTATION=-